LEKDLYKPKSLFSNENKENKKPILTNPPKKGKLTQVLFDKNYKPLFSVCFVIIYFD
jgi:hypothetical protein